MKNIKDPRRDHLDQRELNVRISQDQRGGKHMEADVVKIHTRTRGRQKYHPLVEVKRFSWKSPYFAFRGAILTD